jgi:hypothetical protein
MRQDGSAERREKGMAFLAVLLCISLLLMVGTAALIQWLLKS